MENENDFLTKRPVPVAMGHKGIEYDFDWYKRAKSFFIAKRRAKKLAKEFYVNTIFKLKAIANPDVYKKYRLSVEDAKLLLTILDEKDEWIKDRWRK